jgi:hypothetical protein
MNDDYDDCIDAAVTVNDDWTGCMTVQSSGLMVVSGARAYFTFE